MRKRSLMGVDCKIYLPPQVALDYVACAVALAGGARSEIAAFGGDRPFEAIYVASLTVKPSTIATLANVVFHDEVRNVSHKLVYHFEFGVAGERGFMPRSHPYWLAVGRKVVDAFGGRIDYDDSDDKYADYETPLRWPENWSGNAGFATLQEILRSIEPVTEDDIQAMRMYAYYAEVGL